MSAETIVNPVSGKVARLTLPAFWDLFALEARDKMREILARHTTGTVAVACYERLEIDGQGPGRTARMIGPGWTLKDPEDLARHDALLGDGPGTFKYPVAVWVLSDAERTALCVA